MILILTGRNKHLSRLTSGLQMCEKQFQIASKVEEASGHYEIVLVDPSCEKDSFDKLSYDLIGFFDCEDDPRHCDLGEAYHILKDKCKFYAKMNYVEDDRKDSIKNIAFPILPYLMYKNVASADIPKPKDFLPFFVGAPTFIGRSDSFTESKNTDGVYYVAKYEDHYIYNQRYHWLAELRKQEVPHVGGIVFSRSNLSLDWQSKIFGAVEKFRVNQISQKDYIYNLIYFGMGLCPTGHERLSWRHFDIMSTGSIMIRTDDRNQKWLYNPVEFITVRDNDNICDILRIYSSSFEELHKSASRNREVLSRLTPEIVWKEFINQI